MSDRLNEAANFDVLGDVLETLRFRGTIFFRSDLAAPWGLALAPAHMPRFHIALAGDCFVRAEGSEDVNVQHMDIVINKQPLSRLIK